MNNNLTGIVIDPGHGGTDPGAIGNNQYDIFMGNQHQNPEE